jgi:hypothetical protein
MSKPTVREDVEIVIASPNGETHLKGDLAGVHTDAQKLQQLLDLLGVPKGTEVRVVTRAASVINR